MAKKESIRKFRARIAARDKTRADAIEKYGFVPDDWGLQEYRVSKVKLPKSVAALLKKAGELKELWTAKPPNDTKRVANAAKIVTLLVRSAVPEQEITVAVRHWCETNLEAPPCNKFESKQLGDWINETITLAAKGIYRVNLGLFLGLKAIREWEDQQAEFDAHAWRVRERAGAKSEARVKRVAIIREAIEKAIEPFGTPNGPNRPNGPAVFLGGLPADTDIIDAVARLDAAKGTGRKKIDILRELTGETLGADLKAQSLYNRIRMMNNRGKLSR